MEPVTPLNEKLKKAVPGYVDVAGKEGKRYQASDGKLYHNHFGPVLNQIGGIIPGLDKAYTGYYNSVADNVGTERRDGTVKPTERTRRFADLRGSKTPGSDEPASAMPPSDKPPVVPTGDVKPPEAPVVPESSSVVTGTDTSRSRRDDVRNADYNTARGALTSESSAADRNAVLDTGMAAWAAANPELAAKVRQSKTKQSGYDAIMGGPATETQMAGYDKEETCKPSSSNEGHRQDPSNAGSIAAN